ncbi:hypothetical protein LXL04_018167 [Taraxacum kok-saghyz]
MFRYTSQPITPSFSITSPPSPFQALADADYMAEILSREQGVIAKRGAKYWQVTEEKSLEHGSKILAKETTGPPPAPTGPPPAPTTGPPPDHRRTTVGAPPAPIGTLDH